MLGRGVVTSCSGPNKLFLRLISESIPDYPRRRNVTSAARIRKVTFSPLIFHKPPREFCLFARRAIYLFTAVKCVVCILIFQYLYTCQFFSVLSRSCKHLSYFDSIRSAHFQRTITPQVGSYYRRNKKKNSNIINGQPRKLFCVHRKLQIYSETQVFAN
jgi:hypothetical protein